MIVSGDDIKMKEKKSDSRAASRTVAFSETSHLHGTCWTRCTIEITTALHVVAGGSWSEDTVETCGSYIYASSVCIIIST